MKRYVFILALLACGTAWSQTPAIDTAAVADTADSEENVIGGRVMRSNEQKESNVLGAPVYYNIDGSVRSGGHRGNPRPAGEYNRPLHHYRNTLSSKFNTYFCEGEVMLGDKDCAIGMNFTYLPERWGVYGSMLAGGRHNYASLGAALRFSDTEDDIDWHLFGGVICGDGFGGEFGMRMGSSRNKSGFGWCTGSMGVVVMDGRGYMTLGLSLDLMAITGLTLLLF